ncbi:hypothetical protein [Leptolyngbya sp. PCC 6406]|nr:hypothetical protein [Leptolyngbya sp. PCC 6406]
MAIFIPNDPLVLCGGNTLAVLSWHTRPLTLALSQGARGPENVGLISTLY